MDEKKILELIKKRLEKLGYNINELTTTQQKHLIKIETEISKRLEKQAESLNLIKENKINIATISTATGIARKTFYNNEILKQYIQQSEDDYKSNLPSNDNENLKNQLNEAKDIITKMVYRDVMIETLKAQIEELQNEILTNQQEIEALTTENLSLSIKLQEYEKKKSKKTSIHVLK